MPSRDLDRIVLSWPKHLTAGEEVQAAGPRRSWIQVAKTGTFFSNRYGQFSITKNDLAQMLRNFQEVMPAPPTELPVDYDHLSMDPKRPGDGIAAGWIKRLELRNEGTELWAEVEWTEAAAERIANGEYRFVSPSFVKDYTHKDGRKIGTTLVAAAITNHPFLEGMQALTLYNFSVVGDLAMDESQRIDGGFGEYADFDDCVAKNADKDDPKAYCAFVKRAIEGSATPLDKATLEAQWAASRAVQLSEVGQRVTVSPESGQAADRAGEVFEIVEVVGEGSNAFVALKAADGTILKWFRVTELQPAPPEAASSEAAPTDRRRPPEPTEASAARHLKRVVSALLGAKSVKREPMKFMLRNDKNEEIEVTAAQLEAAGIRIVPEGSTVIGTQELNELKGKVTSLSAQVESLAAVAEASQKAAAQMELKAELDRLSKGGFITKPMRDYAERKWGDTTDLQGFKEWASACTTVIVKLNTEHGSSANAPEATGEDATAELLSLANTIARERGISLRDAIIQASAQRPDAAEAYRDQFALP